MSTAMVTARMARAKKEAGIEMLSRLGTNASEAINRLFDYVLEKGALPFTQAEEERRYTAAQLAQAESFLSGIPHLAPCELDYLNSHELRQRRLVERGLAHGDDFK